MNQTLTEVQMKIAVIEEVKVFKHDKWSIAERVDASSYLDSLSVHYITSFYVDDCIKDLCVVDGVRRSSLATPLQLKWEVCSVVLLDQRCIWLVCDLASGIIWKGLKMA